MYLSDPEQCSITQDYPEFFNSYYKSVFYIINKFNSIVVAYVVDVVDY